MDLPQGFHSQGENLVDRLVKSLYGLKQQSQHDHSLFTKHSKQGTVIILVYVDDMLIAGDSLEQILETKTALQNAFKMKDLGELKYFLGIEFARSSKGITMHKRKYALELTSEAGLAASKPANTPIDINVKLTSRQYDETIKDKVYIEEDPLTDQSGYHRLIRKLLYLTVTRPDISFAVQTLSQFLQDPKKSHMDVALRIMRYIKKQPGQGLLLSSKFRNEITEFCDADWASCPITRRFVTGFMIKFGDSLVSWKSKK
ncbi:uncharacterized mitochondrial protein AtMg00810-like [Lycium barbarum]|uniref:uncharacterized mitochondrial protein AtMg00810-like n=1 Tax=Lycium barbarum TaxID=112863 RepID=UPI00293F363C|nr:uncharacterized mitochondrial protein AtMg00810-like [Lycium barbarum]